MIKRTISGQIDKGDVNHNNRKFIADNVDRTRVKDNITIINNEITSSFASSPSRSTRDSGSVSCSDWNGKT